MTTKTCDLCGANIRTSDRSFPYLPEIRFELGKNEHGAPRLCRMIDLERGGGPRYECCFVTTGLDFCADCILKAFKKAVAELEPPGMI